LTPRHEETIALLEARRRRPNTQNARRAPSEPLLVVEDLVVDHRRPPLRAVAGVSLAIARGERLGLVGESGSGKSSLARAIAALLPARAGKVLLDGAPNAGATRRLQMVFQDPDASLDPLMSVGASIEEPLIGFGLGDRTARAKRVVEQLAAVGLDPSLATRLPHQLSGGQKQRVAIARALAPEPELLIADEPLSAVDAAAQGELLALFSALKLALLFISHDIEAVAAIADRIAVMFLGRIVEIAPVEALQRRPAHPYTAALFAAVPLPDPKREKERARSAKPLEGEPPSTFSPPSGCAFHPRCPIAVERCKTERPALRVLEGAHQVACHLAEDRR
jgi:peptide/nickel transport system ATP-binding protein